MISFTTTIAQLNFLLVLYDAKKESEQPKLCKQPPVITRKARSLCQSVGDSIRGIDNRVFHLLFANAARLVAQSPTSAIRGRMRSDLNLGTFRRCAILINVQRGLSTAIIRWVTREPQMCHIACLSASRCPAKPATLGRAQVQSPLCPLLLLLPSPPCLPRLSSEYST